tara:strand:- start:2162 stop:3202 length:1041 start_codon:yes stop_codon:yes gene_type:complete
MKLSVAKEIIKEILLQNLANYKKPNYKIVVPYLVGLAGIGKTSIIYQIAEEISEAIKESFAVAELPLAQYSETDIAGWALPNADRTAMVRVRPDWMPTCGKGIAFMDEMGQALTPVANASRQVVNERRINVHHLPDGWFVVAAGNRHGDRAGTNAIPTHMKDCLLFLEVEPDVEDTVRYFNGIGADNRVGSYLRFRPEWLSKFERDADACPSPRSWERVASIINYNLGPLAMSETISGMVGKAACVDFMTYLRSFSKMPTVDEVLADPDGTRVPDDMGAVYALCGALASNMTDKNASAIFKYVSKLADKEFIAFLVKDAVAREPSLKQNKSLRQWVMDEGRDLLLG